VTVPIPANMALEATDTALVKSVPFTANVPLLTAASVKVFVLESVSVPAPVFVNAPLRLKHAGQLDFVRQFLRKPLFAHANAAAIQGEAPFANQRCRFGEPTLDRKESR